jgi:hypothetical protein
LAKRSIFVVGRPMLMNPKRTMTLNLTDQEMSVLDQLSVQKDLSKTALIRQALRLYQLVDARITRGEKLFFEDQDKQKAELMVL